MTSRSSPLSARYSSLSKSSLLRKYVKSVPSATPATWAIRAVGALTPSSAITCVAAARRALRLSSLLGRAMSDHSLIISPAAARKGRARLRGSGSSRNEHRAQPLGARAAPAHDRDEPARRGDEVALAIAPGLSCGLHHPATPQPTGQRPR